MDNFNFKMNKNYKNILIIGGSGFIGSHVADYLSKKKFRVLLFDKKKNNFNKNCKKFYGDFLNSRTIEKLIKKSDVVFNFAALADIDKARKRPEETINQNILSTVKLLKYCNRYKVKRFIQASSIYANSEEGGFYAISKRSAEDYIDEFSKIYNLKYTILRFGSLYGERSDSNNGVKKLINSAYTKKKLIYRGSKQASRKYIYVKDAAKLCERILKKKYENKCIILTGKKNIKIKNLISFLANNFNVDKKNILYKNEKNTGHYNLKPTVRKNKRGEPLYVANEYPFKKRLIELIRGLKKI